MIPVRHSLILFQVSCSGEFELQLLSFKNDQGLDSDGNCCNGYRTGTGCSGLCRTFFSICLKHYQATISPDPPCTFGSITTPRLGDNSFNFSDSADSFTNPISLPFDFAWPVSQFFTWLWPCPGVKTAGMVAAPPGLISLACFTCSTQQACLGASVRLTCLTWLILPLIYVMQFQTLYI